MPPSEHEREKIERLRRAMYSRGLSDQLKERPRHQLDDENETVGEDWVEPDEKLAGVTVAPRFIGATRAVLWWLLAIALIFFIGAVSFFAYFFLFGKGGLNASASNIDISVSGPPEISGGEPAELQVSVTNNNNVPLELADLVVTYPSGTRSPTDFATDLPSTRISLGTIEAGGKRQGTISAVFSGAGGSHADVKVELDYHIGGSNAIFVASTDYALTFKSSPITLSVDGNTETVSGQPLQFTVSAVSNANAPQKDVLLHVDYPFGFKFTSATPAADAPNTWELGDFTPGQKKTVQITGVLSGEAGDARVFHVTAGTRSSDTTTSIDTTLADTTYPLDISGAFLGLTIQANTDNQETATTTFSKPSSTNPIATPGSTVNVVIRYVNNLAINISDAVIVAKLSGAQIDGTTVNTSDGVYRSGDGVVYWDKTTTGGELGNIAAGAKGTVSFSFQVPQNAASNGSPSIDISVNAAGKRLDETGVPQSLQSVAVQKVQIASNLQLAAQGLYNANPFGPSGPMPPEASNETTYALVFTVTNTTNKITDAVMTAHMPPYVRWVGIYSPSTENVTFNQSESTVSWNIGDIAPGVGLNGVEPRQAAIAIGFTPSTSQIGESPVLLSDITLTGTDDATGQPVSIPAKDITTNILGDPGFSPANAIVVQ